MSAGVPRVITLGTAGGPVWWRGEKRRTGIATAVVVGDRSYIVDAGTGVGRQIIEAGLAMADVRAIFLTHLHSDHVVDLGSLALFGIMRMPTDPTHTVQIIGPGDRGCLPRPSPRASERLGPVFPEEATPGTARMFAHLMRAYATDINDRLYDSLRPTPLDWFSARDIRIPEDVGFHPNDRPTPDMEPFPIYEDDAVRVTATLVKHAPMAPAFGYRFDTEAGSVVISGDTGRTDNIARLASGAGLLLHEAIDFDWVESEFAGRNDASARATRDHHYSAHTSPREAIDLAEQAGVPRLALHHLVPIITDQVMARDAPSFSGAFSIPSDLDAYELR
ncbi:MBL fold metallo-hydrolase [Leucobacter allii]|uniref:MBL fold metallo-hydrolase n=1 Tax=Leucobacter allii TaxID=2932247 RepID=UPI001FD43284|nr:MBL fold metallo-hydrolase [Leucobacter allii]UOR03305.1 MBL fold metallo-hydrolase [Leucobacter allii]